MILDNINSPQDLKALPIDKLPELAQEIRELIISTTAENGGHLAPNLGVVELTIALHYVFDTPTDKIIWDVGHQSYTHKILTGRKDKFATIRQEGGISGFCAKMRANTTASLPDIAVIPFPWRWEWLKLVISGERTIK